MDGVDSAPLESESQATAEEVQNVQDVQDEAEAETVYHEPVQEPQRSSKRAKALKDAGLPQSFAALRPSSLPAPSHIRPPIRSRTRSDDNEVKQFT